MDTTNSKRYTIQPVTIDGVKKKYYVCSESESREFVGSSGSLSGIKALCWELGISKDEVEFI